MHSAIRVAVASAIVATATFLISADTTPASEASEVQLRIGDLLFAATNIARHLQVEPEAALKLTNRKFRRRFRHIETALYEQGKTFDSTSIEEMENLWQEAKGCP